MSPIATNPQRLCGETQNNSGLAARVGTRVTQGHSAKRRAQGSDDVFDGARGGIAGGQPVAAAAEAGRDRGQIDI